MLFVPDAECGARDGTFLVLVFWLNLMVQRQTAFDKSHVDKVARLCQDPQGVLFRNWTIGIALRYASRLVAINSCRVRMGNRSIVIHLQIVKRSFFAP